jgi:hypothetical protein
MVETIVDPRYINKVKLYALLSSLFAGSWRAEVSLTKWTETSNVRFAKVQGSEADFIPDSKREVGDRDA